MCIYRADKPEYIKKAIESILNQTYPCDLYLYLDGELTIDIETVVCKYETNEKVMVFSNAENKGLAYGLNYLIDKALQSKYKYIARMDSDDISRENRIERQVEYLECHPEIDVLGTSCHEFGAEFAIEEKHLPTKHNDLVDFSITRCPFIHPSVMIRSTVFNKGHRYPTDTTLTEDMALWFELLRAGYKFSNVNEVLIDYRLNESTINRRKGMLKALSEIRIRMINMFLLRKVSLKNIVLISFRLFFHLLPLSIVKFAYKKLR